jgi:hypothetical protein
MQAKPSLNVIELQQSKKANIKRLNSSDNVEKTKITAQITNVK